MVLITGGLGGIGLASAEHLAREFGARLVLMSRSALPPRESWTDLRKRLGESHPLSERLAVLERLDHMGAEYLVVRADVTDIEEVRAAVQAVVDAQKAKQG